MKLRLDDILIAEWRRAWRYLSVQIPALGAALYAVWFIFPSILPTRAVIAIGAFIFVSTMVARYFPQSKVAPDE